MKLYKPIPFIKPLRYNQTVVKSKMEEIIMVEIQDIISTLEE